MKQYKIEIFLALIAVLLQSSHLVFDYTGMRSDIFLFYDYEGGRLVSMLLYEISKLFALCVFSGLLWFHSKYGFTYDFTKLYFAFFIWFMIEFLGYILFFGQDVNFVGYPVFALLLFRAWDQKKH